SGSGCQSSGLQSLRRDGCLRRPERIRIENDPRTLHAGGRDSYERQRRHLRSASHLEPSRRCPTRGALHDGSAELPGVDGELSESTGSCRREEVVYETANDLRLSPPYPLSPRGRGESGGGAAKEGSMPADVILHNAKIATNRIPSFVEAIAIEGSKILAAGTNEEALRHRGRTTLVIDAGGRTVIPGLYDSHLHLIRGGLNYNMELRWDGVPSLADALRLLKDQARRTPPPQWVRVVGGWTEFQFAERRMPTLDEINAAAPETPVFVLHLYDRALLNGTALRACGYTKETPDPPGG